MRPAGGAPRADRTDLRLAPSALSAWAGSGWAVGAPATAALVVAGCALLTAGLLVLGRRRWPPGASVAMALTAGGVVVLVTAGHVAVRQAGLLADLVDDRATVRVLATVSDDPARVAPDPDRPWTAENPRWVVRVTVSEVVGRGQQGGAKAPVLVLGGGAWADVRPGEQVTARGRLAPTDDGDDVIGLLVATTTPERMRSPPGWQREAEQLRAGLRRAAEPLPPDAAGLLPGLVVGDTSRLPPDLEEAMRVAGLTHLCAVSGANVAIVCGTVLLVAGGCGAGRRVRLVIAGAALAGFVVLARPDPSVLRAAVMGAVGLVGLAAGRTRRGVSALAGAVVLLTAIDPWLSRSFGFALSVLATAGLLLLARPWALRLARRMPLPLAQALAVPAAAQAVCAPVVVLLTPEVPLLAVPANLIVAPAVAPATVLGVLAVLVEPWWAAGAVGIAWVAGWATSWIALVARASAAVPFASLGWVAGWRGAALLAAVTVLGVVLLAFLLRAGRGRGVDRRVVLAVTAALAVVAVIAVRPPWAARGAWPPAGWLVVACDVGQGDALVIATGPGAGVVVDAGPEPAAVDACLTRLAVERVDLLVLTHFHADHVAGLDGVLRGREVAEALVSPLRAPEQGAERALRSLEDAAVDVIEADAGMAGSAGSVSWSVLWPDAPLREHRDDADAEVNDASVVVLVEVAGLRLLATGDVEPQAQEGLRAELQRRGEPAVDVLKVAHHGSAHQDPALHRLLAPRLALVSVGDDNDYGHPAPAALALLDEVGAVVARTDVHGDVAVGAGDGSGLWVAGSRRDPEPSRGRVLRRRRHVAGCGCGSPPSTRPHLARRRARAGGARHRHRGPPRRAGGRHGPPPRA